MEKDTHGGPESAGKFRKYLEDFKTGLDDYRDTFQQEDGKYVSIKKDESYKVLLEEGNLAEGDPDAQSYPFWSSFKDAQKKDRVKESDSDPKYASINWKEEDSKVYLKVFQEEDAEEVRNRRIEMARRGYISPNDLLKKELADTKKDLERFIGENVVSGVATIILLIGGGGLLNYLIDTGVLLPGGRSILGFLAGFFLLGVSYNVSKRSANVASIFVMLSVIVLHYITYTSLYEYSTIPLWGAFAMHLLTAAVAVFFSVWYNKKNLLVIGLASAYLAPVMVSIDLDNYIFMFSYLLTLNISLMVFAYFTKLKNINLLTYAISILFFASWVFRVDHTDDTLFSAVIFTTAFYIAYFMNNTAYYLRAGVNATQGDIQMHVINTLIYFVAGWVILYQWESLAFIGKFTAGIAIFNFVYAFILYGHKEMDYKVLQLFFLFVVFFFTLSVPLHLRDSLTNVFWGVEAVVLVWVARQVKETVLRDSSVYVVALTLLSLAYVWLEVYLSDDVQPFFNKGFLAGGVTFLCLLLIVWMLTKEKENDKISFFTIGKYVISLGVIMIMIGYASGTIELQYYADHHYGNKHLRRLLIAIYNMAFVLLVRFMAHQSNLKPIRVISASLMGFVILAYLFYGHSSSIALRNAFLEGHLPLWQFGMHYVVLGMKILMIYLLIRDTVRSEGYASGSYGYVLWFTAFIFVFHLSSELDNMMVIFGSEYAEMARRLFLSRFVGYTAVWSLCAIAFMFFGLRYRIKQLRVISFTLLTITIIKFFTYDVQHIDTLGRIIATIFLGGILLLVSLMYNKLRALMMEGRLEYDRDQNPEMATLERRLFSKKHETGDRDVKPASKKKEDPDIEAPPAKNDLNLQKEKTGLDDEDKKPL